MKYKPTPHLRKLRDTEYLNGKQSPPQPLKSGPAVKLGRALRRRLKAVKS